MTFDDLLATTAQTGKPIILSTGMSNIDEVKNALDVLVNAGTKKNNIIVS